MIKKKDGFRGERQVVLSPMMVKLEEGDELCRGLFITDIGYYPKAEHHHRVREQGIDQYVLIYCTDGSGFYTIGNKRYEVRKGQYFILPANRPHEYGASEGCDWTIYWVHFRGDFAHVYAEGATQPQDIYVSLHSRISERLDIFEEIISTLHSTEQQGMGDATELGIEDLRYASSLLHHFLASMRYLAQFRKAKTIAEDKADGIANEHIDIVEQAIHYMRENIEQRIAMDDVLRYVGYSQSHFSSLFKKRTGKSPLSYFNQLKIERACQLLRETDMKINQICYKVGIDDSLYFSRLFSKTMGMSPTEFRINSSR